MKKPLPKPQRRYHVDLYHHGLPAADPRLDAILTKLDTLIAKEILMAGELDALTAEVARNTDVDQSAILLLKGLAEKIEALKNQPAALQALADTLKGSSDKLADAITTGTPAA